MSITYADMKLKVERDMDIEDEDFIQTTELLAYFNDAIRECEAHIHKLGLEDQYFMTSDAPTLVVGTSDYSMPSDIYLNKIVECVYNDGTRFFEVKRLKGTRKHLKKAEILNYTNNMPIYVYDVTSASAAAGTKWVLVPASKEASTNITRWYIRSVEVMVDDTSVCDLPNVCLNFLYAYVTWKIWVKEGDPRADVSASYALQQKELMIQTLAEMTPDDNNEVEMDFSTYDEMS